MVILLYFFSLRINYEIVLLGVFVVCFYGFVVFLKVIFLFLMGKSVEGMIFYCNVLCLVLVVII